MGSTDTKSGEKEGFYNIHTLNMSHPRDASRDEGEDLFKVRQVTNDEVKGSGRSNLISEVSGKN